MDVEGNSQEDPPEESAHAAPGPSLMGSNQQQGKSRKRSLSPDWEEVTQISRPAVENQSARGVAKLKDGARLLPAGVGSPDEKAADTIPDDGRDLLPAADGKRRQTSPPQLTSRLFLL